MKGRYTKSFLRVLLGAGFLALAGGLLWFWLRPPQVTVTEVSERRITPSIQGIGTVESKLVVNIASKIPGRLVSIDVDQGDTVSNGQVLATLEDSELRAEMERAESTLQRSRSTAEVRRAEIQRALSAAEVQRASVQRIITNREVPRASLRRAKSAVTSIDSTISKLRTLRLQAQNNASRWQKLYQSGDVSKMDLEERLTQAKAADDDVKNAEAQRNTALEDVKNIEAQINTVGEDVKQAQAQLKVANDDVATLRTGLKVIEQDISVAEAALASADARKSEGVIVSQISGYVVSRELEPGAVVNPGTPILKIADPTTIWATVFIDESNSNSFEVGDLAEITLRSMQTGNVQGKVTRIQRESDRVTEQVAVDISFERIPENIRLGEQLEAIIRPKTRTLKVIPASALIRSKEGIGVWLVIENRLHFRKIQTGMVDASGWAEVISGLESGDKVVVSPGKLSDLSNEGRRVSSAAEESKEEPQVKQ